MQRAPDTLADAGHHDRQTVPAAGAIQPHGVMLVVSPGDYLVLYASANARALLGAEVTISPGMPLGDIVGRAAAHAIRNASARSGGGESPGVALNLRLDHAPDPVDVVVHRRAERVMIEFEPSRETGAGAGDALDMSLAFVRRMNAGAGTEDLATTGARLMRAMLGYDRVMICKCVDSKSLDNGPLRVIAEAKRANQPCLLDHELDQEELDLEFPAGEIADQECSPNTSGLVRIIVDATAVPALLEPAPHPGDQPVDMSLAQLRPASAAHRQYLRDLGVAATLTVPILVDGQFWGLILCRHDSPRNIPVPLRMAAELFGQTLSLHMTVAEHLAQAQATAPDDAGVAAPRDTIAGLTILLVEDEYLIALDTEDMLQSRDVAEVLVAQDDREATGILETCTPDAAVLDFNLGAHTAQGLAERLLASGVPVIFVTGYGDSTMIPEHLRMIPVARKPASSADLEQQLLEAFRRFRPAV